VRSFPAALSGGDSDTNIVIAASFMILARRLPFRAANADHDLQEVRKVGKLPKGARAACIGDKAMPPV
jgi:hypothetical protein